MFFFPFDVEYFESKIFHPKCTKLACLLRVATMLTQSQPLKDTQVWYTLDEKFWTQSIQHQMERKTLPRNQIINSNNHLFSSHATSFTSYIQWSQKLEISKNKSVLVCLVWQAWLVGLIQMVWLGRFGLVCLVWFGRFDLAGLIGQVWFGRFGFANLPNVAYLAYHFSMRVRVQ